MVTFTNCFIIERNRGMNNGNGFYKTGLLKGFIACALVALITCGITVHKYVYAEEIGRAHV